jgi:hypothetical protein
VSQLQTYDSELYAVYLLEQAQRQESQKACGIAVEQWLRKHDRLGTGEESFEKLLCEIERADRHDQRHLNRGCDAV